MTKSASASVRVPARPPGPGAGGLRSAHAAFVPEDRLPRHLQGHGPPRGDVDPPRARPRPSDPGFARLRRLCALDFRTAFSRAGPPARARAGRGVSGNADLQPGRAHGNPGPADLPGCASRCPRRSPKPAIELARMRRGMAALMARFEPDRFAAHDQDHGDARARGRRSPGLQIHEPMLHAVQVPPPISGSRVVH